MTNVASCCVRLGRTCGSPSRRPLPMLHGIRKKSSSVSNPACPEVQAIHEALEVQAAAPKSPGYFQHQQDMQHHPRRASEVLAAAPRASLYKSMVAHQQTVQHPRNYLLRSKRTMKKLELRSSESSWNHF